jgi:ABC-2 type transport system permease protein
MAFLSGSFVPTQEYPSWLQHASEVLPLKHFISLVTDASLDDLAPWEDWVSVVVLLAWGLAGVIIAMRRFGWSPRER